MRLPEMSHLIACAYAKMCVDLIRYNFSETFFPLRTSLPQNLNDRIMCIGWISKSLHFVPVYLKLGQLIQEQTLRLGRTILWKRCKSSRN